MRSLIIGMTTGIALFAVAVIPALNNLEAKAEDINEIQALTKEVQELKFYLQETIICTRELYKGTKTSCAITIDTNKIK